MKYLSLFFLSLFAAGFSVAAQELDARVTVNADRLQGEERDLFPNLQELLVNYINESKWTDATFSMSEKIPCNFSIIVTESLGSNNFKGEIQVQASRPVYNSAYTTTLFNHRDTSFEFEFSTGQSLYWSEGTIENNIVAVVTFYIYIVLGIDFDSFSPMGGAPYFQQAMNIVNMAQSLGATGWGAFQDPANRHAIATAYTDERMKVFRQLWYDYHRKGLDEMAANPDRGRMNIITAVKLLEAVRSAQPNTCLLTLFATSKLDEVVSVYSKANTQEKQEGLKFLSNIFPAEATRLEPLKK